MCPVNVKYHYYYEWSVIKRKRGAWTVRLSGKVGGRERLEELRVSKGESSRAEV